MAQQIAHRYKEPAILEKAIFEYQQFKGLNNWHAISLSAGYSGLAVMSSQLQACFPDQGWQQTGSRYLSHSLNEIHQQVPLTVGLHNGLCGVAFALLQLNQTGNNHEQLLNVLDDRLITIVHEQATSVILDSSGVSSHIFDIMSGITGIGAYLITRYRSNKNVLKPLQTILNYLIDLSAETSGIPNWYTPVQYIIDPDAQSHFPNGCINLGMAHGIAGVLSLLALASLENIPVAGIDTALTFGAEWLLNHRVDTRWGLGWPTIVSAQIDDASMFNPVRTSWCWGSPGIARALWLVGKALHSQIYQDVAIETMIGVHKRPTGQQYLPSPSFCHGISGLLHITLRFANDTHLACFWNAADNLLQILLNLAEPESLLGYRHVHDDNLKINQPWLTDGVAGIVLVLLAASQEHTPTWDRVFLVA